MKLSFEITPAALKVLFTGLTALLAGIGLYISQ